MSITIVNSEVNADFNISELTSGTLDGNGVFDILMRVVDEHINKQFDNNRIRGTDYANAYIQLMNMVLNHAGDYALAKAKLPLEMQLLKKELELKEFELNQIKPKELEALSAENALKKAQLPILEKELNLKEQQLDLNKKELQLKELQIPLMEKEIDIKDKQLNLAQYELDFKAPAEVDSIKAQTEYSRQRTVTEKGQTDGSVINPESVLGITNFATKEQGKALLRDYNYKLATLYVDSWKTRYAADPDDANNDPTDINKLGNNTVGTILSKAAQEAGISI